MTRTNSDKLDDLAAALAQFQASMTVKLDAVTNCVGSLERQSSESGTTLPDPLGWIFKISQFFVYHNTPEEERITVASFYLDGAALAWYQWMYKNAQILSWAQFLHALELRFAPTAYDDPRGKLFKLHQTTSVSSYLSDFEALANRIVGLSPSDLLSCFVSGLKTEIRREVLAQQPRDLSQEAGLARLQEEKLYDLLKLVRPKSPYPPWPGSSSSRSSPPLRATADATANKTNPPLLPSPPLKTRFRQLSAEELMERHEEESEGVQEEKEEVLEESPPDPLLAFPSPQLKVIVGNGEELISNHVCKGVQLSIQGHKFEVDLYTLALSGPDIVLGIPWLKTLGPVLMDYGNLTMKFAHAQQQVELKGEQGPITYSISYHQLKRLVQQEPTAQIFSLSINHTTTAPPPIKSIGHRNHSIHHLLQHYASLFDEPTQLPPPRFTDHRIPLVPNAAPVNKKYGTWRMCVDYRALNALTIKDRFPLPTVDELLDELGSARVFTKQDLTSGFHQIRLNPEDTMKTAFRTHDGHYEYKVMPFGLCNAPTTFQATMNDIFRPLLRRTVIVFFDDILVYSATEEQHVKHLEHVFHLLSEHKLFLKIHKCSFGQTKIDYLGHVVEGGTVAPDPSKVQAIVDWPSPKTLKALCGFLGLSDYYRKFIKGYTSIAQPLTNLLKKDAFQWNYEAQMALEKLKQAMISAPVLALPDFSSHFVVQTDASGYAMGAVLLQKNHPLAFYSCVFCPRLEKASTYIQPQRNSHASNSNARTTILFGQIVGYHYEIQYKPGATNIAADALSRVSSNTHSSMLQLTVPQFLFLEELKQELLLDPLFLDLRNRCLSDPTSLPEFQVVDGLLLRRGRIWISPASRFKHLLLWEFHETLVGGHAGLTKTMKRLSENFYWDNMKKEAQVFINVSMDFVTGLPLSKGYTVILVVVDRFSKAIHLGALATGFTAYKVAELFVSIVCKLHGLPKSIVSDRDPIFISRFWSDLFKFSGTLLRMSSSYHPQPDGQTEVMNRTVEQYLRAFVHEKPSQWVTLLPWAEYHYNTSIHTDPLSREEILALLRKKLIKAQAQMKASADKHRRDVNFPVGGWVYLKLQPYRQVSVSRVKYHKLAKRYYGPYLILAKVGSVAYKLALPPHPKIQNVFHCSLLKLHEGPPPTIIDQIPPASFENHPLITPLAILDFQTNIIDGKAVRFALVQWRGLLSDDTSWENWEELCRVHNLEDKVGFVGGDIDMDQPIIQSPIEDNRVQGDIVEVSRVKRVSKPPKRLEDYVTNLEATDVEAKN
ncbi:hypothetical protein TSUD_141370 [Trifolium subterraneum]|uniref:Integrase catalytic domain-containing protein n=1 Tax=Trifolium subterraneum TaxID=3900 RepID=A0A2Z6PBC8_TRISU|nr:hypothetical protein TSUD_141370 [Trifolium subterraneum]